MIAATSELLHAHGIAAERKFHGAGIAVGAVLRGYSLMNLAWPFNSPLQVPLSFQNEQRYNMCGVFPSRTEIKFRLSCI